jgi:hypothetical protein
MSGGFSSGLHRKRSGIRPEEMQQCQIDPRVAPPVTTSSKRHRLNLPKHKTSKEAIKYPAVIQHLAHIPKKSSPADIDRGARQLEISVTVTISCA